MNLDSPAAPATDVGFFAGVELGSAIIRAGVFTPDGHLKGKTKVSTKIERGPAVVMERVTRCVRYAVDECDLRMSDIASVGVACPGQVGRDGRLLRSSALGWGHVDVAGELGMSLGRPVAAGQLYELSALGIVAKEFGAVEASRVLVIFPNPQIGAAMLVDGTPVFLGEGFDGGVDRESLSENVIAVVAHPVFGSFRGRDFRKALKKDPSGQLKAYAVQLGIRSGELAAQLAARFSPDLVILGGAVVEEVGGEILSAAREGYRAAAGTEVPELKWEVSSLGELAAITGAAWFAQSRTVSPAIHPANAPLLEGLLPA